MVTQALELLSLQTARRNAWMWELGQRLLRNRPTAQPGRKR